MSIFATCYHFSGETAYAVPPFSSEEHMSLCFFFFGEDQSHKPSIPACVVGISFLFNLIVSCC